ncbi:hypothetical protein INR49_002278 [Caranx melampygus]|nr:hypothetical protein INR49_002278 [Caranx melampygus]
MELTSDMDTTVDTTAGECLNVKFWTISLDTCGKLKRSCLFQCSVRLIVMHWTSSWCMMIRPTL